MDSTSAPRRPGARGVPECVYITPGAPRDHQGLSGTGRRRPTGAVSGERSRVQTRIWTVFDRGAVKEEDWLRADDQDRFFRLGKVVGTPPRFQTSPNALTYLQFRMAFQRPEFKAFFESISGMPLGWSDDFGAHAMAAGDFLRPHSDDNKDRQLAMVIYLHPGWKRKFGGVLRVVHHDERFTDVEPEYNSLIAFDVLASPAHLVLPIQPGTAGSTRRLSIGGWYHKLG